MCTPCFGANATCTEHCPVCHNPGKRKAHDAAKCSDCMELKRSCQGARKAAGDWHEWVQCDACEKRGGSAQWQRGPPRLAAVHQKTNNLTMMTATCCRSPSRIPTRHRPAMVGCDFPQRTPLLTAQPTPLPTAQPTPLPTAQPMPLSQRRCPRLSPRRCRRTSPRPCRRTSPRTPLPTYQPTE